MIYNRPYALLHQLLKILPQAWFTQNSSQPQACAYCIHVRRDGYREGQTELGREGCRQPEEGRDEYIIL